MIVDPPMAFRVCCLSFRALRTARCLLHFRCRRLYAPLINGMIVRLPSCLLYLHPFLRLRSTAAHYDVVVVSPCLLLYRHFTVRPYTIS